MKKTLGKQKISDIFIDKKIPVSERANYPILVNEKDEVVVIPKIKTSGKFLAKKDDKNIIIVRAIRNEEKNKQ